MTEHHADILLARLSENRLNFLIVPDVVVAFIDIDETGKPLIRPQAGALRGGLIDQREKKPAEQFRAFVLEQAFFRIDENDFSRRVDLGEQIDLRTRA